MICNNKGGRDMAYTALDVAKHIITYSQKKNCPISNLKLQKILYFSWVDYYKETKRELFLDEIKAWQFGPVVPEVYYEFCSYAGCPIMVQYNSILQEDDKKILDSIVENYLSLGVSTLVSKTHQCGKPWDIIFDDGLGYRDSIPFSLIIEKECANVN